MRQTTLLASLLLISIYSYSQQLFFSSPVLVDTKEAFYSSIRLSGETILFNAPDYQLYAYDINTGKENWHYNLKRQSDLAPFFIGNKIWANAKEGAIELDARTGKLNKNLPFNVVFTEPVEKNGFIYGTGQYDGGQVFGYDIKNDSIAWKKFIAHGCSVTPYYFPDRIVANAEGNKWIELDYAGHLKDKKCESAEYNFPSELPCAKEFAYISHDNSERAEYPATDLENVRPMYSTNKKYTAFLSANELILLEGKGKVKYQTELSSLDDTISFDEYEYRTLLTADDSTCSFVHSKYFFRYNFQQKRISKLVSLADWNIHAAILNNGRLWFISKKDGRLYGVVL